MHLVQLLLPLYDNDKRPFARVEFDRVRQHLTDHFGGVTAFLRSPAVGLWKEGDDEIGRDVVVMFEVMTEDLDEAWWKEYREKLQAQFKQEELVIRALEMKRL